jgi:hypothetical protein
MDKANEEGHELSAGLDGQKWLDVERVLSWVVDTDEDDLVKGHAATVLESREAFAMTRITGHARSPADAPLTFDLTQLRGLSVNPTQTGTARIQEID